MRPNGLQISIILTFKIFVRAKTHGKKFLKLCQTSSGGIVYCTVLKLCFVIFLSCRYWLKGCLVLTCLLGVTWIFGLFYLDHDTVIFAYIFTILNALQVLDDLFPVNFKFLVQEMSLENFMIV